MKKSELKALILECKQELAEEAITYTAQDLTEFKEYFNKFNKAVFAQAGPNPDEAIGADLLKTVKGLKQSLGEIEAVVYNLD
jgi:hypothetical protein